jgi:hypothetical protein
MLVHFNSSVGEFTMHGPIAVQLLKMMGHSGTVPSAILAAEIPAAISRLREALKHAPPPPIPENEDEEREFVPIARRAVPLLELLENAAKYGVDVMWETM